MFEVVAGRYVLIDSIGSGGSGEVWRAFDRKRGDYCAAKVIRRTEAATLVRAVFEQAVRRPVVLLAPVASTLRLPMRGLWLIEALCVAWFLVRLSRLGVHRVGQLPVT